MVPMDNMSCGGVASQRHCVFARVSVSRSIGGVPDRDRGSPTELREGREIRHLDISCSKFNFSLEVSCRTSEENQLKYTECQDNQPAMAPTAPHTRRRVGRRALAGLCHSRSSLPSLPSIYLAVIPSIPPGTHRDGTPYLLWPV